jgi:hypothetical protein
MTRPAWVMVIALGCGESARDRAINRMGEISDMACACQDKACIKKLVVDLQALTDQARRDGVGDDPLDTDGKEQMAKHAERFMMCAAKLDALAPHGKRAGSGSAR